MSAGNVALHQTMQIYAIPPRLADNTTAASDWIDARNARRLFALVNVGATDTTVDAKLEQASDSSGTGAKDVAGSSITQISATGDNRQVGIDLETDRLDHANGFYYVRLLITAGDGTAGANVSGAVLLSARHQPVSQPAAYAETISLAG